MGQACSKKPPPMDKVSTKAKSLYEIGVKDIDGNNIAQLGNICKNKKCVMIINVAGPGIRDVDFYFKFLNEMQREHRDKGFIILAFPCEYFLGTNLEIKEQVRNVYKGEFPLFEKVDTNGEHTHPVY